ncbi:hypothetical protein RQP46_010397 [Phenoliferia psychrophenolica]
MVHHSSLQLTPSPLLSHGHRLADELDAFRLYIQPTQDEMNLRIAVVALFQRLVTALWPDAQCGLFGSCATGLFLPDGDIDLAILSRSLLPLPTTNILATLSRALLSSSFASSVRQIPEARVPIIKFTTTSRYGAVQCDLESQPSDTAADDLVSFFNYYGHKFDYRNKAICVHNGGALLAKRDLGFYSKLNPDRLAIRHPVNLTPDFSNAPNSTGCRNFPNGPNNPLPLRLFPTRIRLPRLRIVTNGQ